jgi:hypothetical protein
MDTKERGKGSLVVFVADTEARAIEPRLKQVGGIESAYLGGGGQLLCQEVE